MTATTAPNATGTTPTPGAITNAFLDAWWAAAVSSMAAFAFAVLVFFAVRLVRARCGGCCAHDGDDAGALPGNRPPVAVIAAERAELNSFLQERYGVFKDPNAARASQPATTPAATDARVQA